MENVKESDLSKFDYHSMLYPIQIRFYGQAVALLFFFFIFSLILIFTGNGANLGFAESYLTGKSSTNDYLLITIVSGVSILGLTLEFFWIVSTQINKKKTIPTFLNSFGSGVRDGLFGILHVVVLFTFFYMIFFRGFWSLTNFSAGFSIYPILKTIFFGMSGIWGYAGFAHNYQINRMLGKNKILEIRDYLGKYNLWND